MEREITGQVDLCDERGRLDPAARGWARQPAVRAELRRPWGRRKQWDYWCVMSRDLVVALTYADLDYVGQASVWMLERATGRTLSAGVLAPFGRGIDLPAQVCTGVQRVERTGLRLEIVESAGATRLIATGTSSRVTGSDAFAVDLEVAKPPGHESLNVVIPWSDRRFQFTSKQNTRPTTGEVRWGGRRWQVGADEVAYAVQDLGRGVWPYANRWNWAAASGTGQDGRVVGLQLGGKWTEGTGCTENALCLDGRVTKIHDELEWTYDWDEPLRPWRVRSPGTDQVDVVLTPTFDRYDLTDLAVVRLEVHQCFGTWSGTVTGDDGVPVRIDGIDGFAEEARNRW